jgi:hypothetical protein
MSVAKIDDLIEAARTAIKDELDLRAIYKWKKQTVECLTQHLGPDHYYTRYFTENLEEVERQHLLTGRGLLAAAREEISQRNEIHES